MKIFFGSTKTDGKEYLIEENLYKCTEKCYNEFYTTKNFTKLYKKTDNKQKINGVYYGICNKCKHQYIDNTIGSENESDLKENVIRRYM